MPPQHTTAKEDTMTDRLKQAVAIITGASRGIGRAIAQAYAQEGASLCLVARNPASLVLSVSASPVLT